MGGGMQRNILEGIQKGLGFCLAVLGVSTVIFLIYFCLLFDKMNAFAQKYILLAQNIPINTNDHDHLQILINKGRILSAKDLLDLSMKYYDTFITILAALLGLGSFLAYFYIRGITRKEAVNETHKAVDDYFEKHSSQVSLESTIEKKVNDWWNDNMPEQEDIKTRLDKIEETVELIRSTQPISEVLEEDTSGSH
jgi:hypothetical protein